MTTRTNQVRYITVTVCYYALRVGLPCYSYNILTTHAICILKLPNPERQMNSDEDVPEPKKPRLEEGKGNVDEHIY